MFKHRYKWAIGFFFATCVVIVVATVAPILTTRPSETARRHWEMEYSPFLPSGYGDFRAHWQNHDTTTRVFSFSRPANLSEQGVLDHLASALPEFRVHDRRPGELVLRRPFLYSRDRFDEYFFLSRPARGRIYGMYAILGPDDAKRHAHLVELFRKDASQ
jgi:hypothetical protein